MPSTNASPSPDFLLQPQRRPGWLAHGLAVVLPALGMEFGWYFWVEEGLGALLWPPAGLAIGLAVVFGLRILPSLGLGVVTWSALATGQLSYGIALGVTLVVQAAVTVVCLRRLEARRWLESPIRELVGFWLAGPLLGGIIGATLGTVALLSFWMSPDGYRVVDVAGAYWLAEAVGILMFAPLAMLLAGALQSRQLLAALRPAGWQLGWLFGLASLALLQVYLIRSGLLGFASTVVYFYFPLMAMAAGLGRPLFQSLATVLISAAFLVQAKAGFGAEVRPQENIEMIGVIALVLAFIMMTQIVSASSESIRNHLRAAEEMAQRDFLTGRLNERGLVQALDDRPARPGALALLDVPAARRIFDLSGIEDANRFERDLVAGLVPHLPPNGQLARLGRGTYGMLIDGPCDQNRVALETVYRSLDARQAHAAGVPLPLNPSIGAIVLGATTLSSNDTVALASLACQHAADQPSPRLRVDNSASRLIEDERDALALVASIRTALDAQQGFVLLGQRIMPTSRAEAARPHYELLLRMIDENGELIPPGRFLPLAARHDLMPSIDRWVIGQAFELAARKPKLAFSINLSGASVSDLNLGGWIAERRQTHNIPPDRICFEITETEAVEDPESAASLVLQLKQQGFRIAIDDFGAGLASFDYIRNFNVDTVKIDGRFIKDLRNNPRDRSIVTAIQRLSRDLGVSTVAEFVEDEWTLEWLTDAGIDFAQGFAIARPAEL
ncbi:MAG: EAL domain-containing protein [Wenzhouxiangella sp.]